MNAYKAREPRITPTKTLGELCLDPVLGGTPPREDPECWNGDNIWVKISDMDTHTIIDTEEKLTDKGVEESSVKKISKGTLLFSFKLTLGKVAFAGKELYTNEAIAGLIPRDNEDKLLSKYLYYILPTLDYTTYAQRATKGFTLNSDSIGDVEVPYPAEPIRKKIVEEGEKKEKEADKLYKEIDKLIADERKLIKELTK